MCGSVLTALGMLTSMFATKINTVYITYGLLAGIGAAINDCCAYTVLAPHFNDRWRPVAVSFSSAGAPLSALVLPPILTVLMEQFDWRKAYLFLTSLSLIGVPVILCVFPPKTQNSQSESRAGQQSNWKLSRLLKHINYMLYLISSFAILFVLFVPATFLPDLMHEYERSSRDVYICLMTMGSADVAVRMLIGFLVQLKPNNLAFIYSAGAIILCVSSGLITFSRSFEAFVIMSGFVGIGTGCFGGLFFFMATHLLPTEDLRFGYGIVLTITGLGIVAGMPLAGFISDFFGTERGAFIFSSVMFFIASLLELTIGIRECCRRKSKMIQVVEVKVNAVEDPRTQREESNDVCLEESTHI